MERGSGYYKVPFGFAWQGCQLCKCARVISIIAILFTYHHKRLRAGACSRIMSTVG